MVVRIAIIFLGLLGRGVLIAIGLIIIPPMTLLKRYHYVDSKYDPKRKILVWKDRFMYIWSNDEDGIDWHANKETKYSNQFVKIIMWSCFRNSANNHRFYGPLSLKLDPTKIGYIASKGFERNWTDPVNMDKNFWFICWQGYRSCIRFHYKRLRVHVGWKILPIDIDKIKPAWRKDGIGITWQFKMMREYK